MGSTSQSFFGFEIFSLDGQNSGRFFTRNFNGASGNPCSQKVHRYILSYVVLCKATKMAG